MEKIIIFFIGCLFGYTIHILRQIAEKIVTNAKIEHDKNLPAFVRMRNDPDKPGTSMRLRYSDDYTRELEYWRDAGEWGIKFKWIQEGLFKRSLFTDSSYYEGDLKERLDNIRLIPITEEVYLIENQGYIPDNYKEGLTPIDLSDYDDLSDDDLPF